MMAMAESNATEDNDEEGSRMEKYVEGLAVYDSPSGLKTRRQQGLDFLRWAHGHAAVSTQNTAVPEGILPAPYSGRLHDLRVYSKARGPDDAVYDAHADLRERLARGNTVLELSGGPEEGHYTVLRALRKFTGGEVWDDDDRCDAGAGDAAHHDAWQRYFTAAAASARRLVSTRKANGEAAHLSAVRVGGEWLLVCGSKNTHMVVRGRDDVALYSGDRFRVARIFSAEICAAVAGMAADRRERLLGFLWRHSLTAVFEILMQDHQHVQDLSFIGRPAALKFIAWTPNQTEASFTALPVDVGLRVAQQLGLDPTGHECLAPDELNAHAAEVLRAYGHEGVVLYFLDADDRTIGLLKKKTAWYVLCRAIREKAKATLAAVRRSADRFSLDAQQQKVKRRLTEIEAWLQLPHEVTLRWLNLANGFLAFVVDAFRKDGLSLAEVTDQFPIVWRRYLDASGQQDRVFDDVEPTGAASSTQ